MTEDEVIEMAEQSNLLDVIDSFHYDTKNWVEEAIAFAKLVAAKEREAIQDEYWMCVNSDLENGVKSLNEKAAERFTKYFPELSKFGSWLEARGDA